MRKVAARSNQRPGRKVGSPKPTGASASIDGAAASRNDEDRRRTLKWMLVTVALLAAVTARRGLASDAENEFKAALRLNPQYTPAAVNLADLYRLLGRNDDGQSVLRTALSHSPNSPDLHHALGLALARLKRTEESLNDASGRTRSRS
jgi:predicted Zn-dependent protease